MTKERKGGREGIRGRTYVSKPRETGMYSLLRSPLMVLGAPITRGREGGREEESRTYRVKAEGDGDVLILQVPVDGLGGTNHPGWAVMSGKVLGLGRREGGREGGQV